MGRVWMYILNPHPNPNLTGSLWPAHESIHGHGCRPISKPTGYPDIHGYPRVMHQNIKSTIFQPQST